MYNTIMMSTGAWVFVVKSLIKIKILYIHDHTHTHNAPLTNNVNNSAHSIDLKNESKTSKESRLKTLLELWPGDTTDFAER